MNKTVLKNFAINARLELLARVRDRATLYGITDEKVKNNQIVASNAFQKLDGQLLSKNEIAQRNALLQRIYSNGYVQVMEEAAYTWFNRFIAIKYMEVHKLLPVDQRVIPQQAGELPQLVREAQNVKLENIDFDTVVQYLDNNRTEELYKYLVIALCNQLSGCLSQMFEKISDYTELLFPDGLMKAESFLGMLANVDDENWQEIQVIGWLYQYYNTDLKNETFDLLKKNIKITKDRIGAATQLFTPEWIVRYMVENSLGRLWYEGHPDDNLKLKWRYFLDEAKQEPDVEKQLAEVRKAREKLQPEEIKLIDPCMGSGHILVYAFDILMDIYRSVGYTDRDAVQSIIQNNIYGLDIDDRAAQLAYFALMMKATEYDKRFLRRNMQPNICSIQESNDIDRNHLNYLGQSMNDLERNNASTQTAALLDEFVDAKEYGSILQPKEYNWSLIASFIEDNTQSLQISFAETGLEESRIQLQQMIMQGKTLAQKYHVVVTNPPYMGNGNLDDRISGYIKTHYLDGRNDLFSVFIMRCMELCEINAYQAMITQHQWMFLSSYARIREIMQERTLINMAHLGAHAFDEIGGEVVQTTTFVIQNTDTKKYSSLFVRLVDEKTEVSKSLHLHDVDKTFYSHVNTFSELPGTPYVYWIGEGLKRLFKCPPADDVIALREGIHTGQNDLFLRLWPEIEISKLVKTAHSESDVDMLGVWVPYNKGGSYRKWYGNNDLVIGFDKLHRDAMARLSGHVRPSQSLYFKSGGTWSALASGKFGLRYYPDGFLFDSKGQVAVGEKAIEIITLFNLKAYQVLADMLMPTLDYKCGDVKKLPYCHIDNPRFIELGKECIRLAKEEYDSFETSWDYQCHPLVVFAIDQRNVYLSKCWQAWERICNDRFVQMKANEENLNRIFIETYKLGNELTPDVNDNDITMRKANLGRDIRSLISYAVGCMFGRYSLDQLGLAYAGGIWDSSKYVTYPADHDGILPITDDEYFQDDIVSMFVRWVKTVYGEETLEENLQFIANALNPNGGTSREVIRSYFLNDFYSDHLKLYQKRPIYWQFDSGKQNGFKALIYLHRYEQDTVARLRTDYVHELQDRYRTQLEDARKTAESGDARQRSAANKRAQKLDKQLTELNKYEELVHHYADMRISLDLDDGVKVNYAKLQDILTKIK